MLTTEERRLQLVELVRKMRAAQKKFFKSRVGEDTAECQTFLEEWLYYERQVDRALKRLPQRKPSDA